MASDRQRGTRVGHRRRLRRPFSHARCRSRTFLLVDRRRHGCSSIDIRYSHKNWRLDEGHRKRVSSLIVCLTRASFEVGLTVSLKSDWFTRLLHKLT